MAGRLRAGKLRSGYLAAVMAVAALGLAAAPGQAATAPPTPLLEFVTPGSAFPIKYTATGGSVIASLDGFASVLNCTGSHGDGEITGPRTTRSEFVFTGCKAQGGELDGIKCKTPGANEEEVVARAIEADLVYISQARREVGVLLNPGGGVYMKFVCGGEEVEASGPFLAPAGPTNVQTPSFTATMTRFGATQVPSEYENPVGEKRLAIPKGNRTGKESPGTTGVELKFTIQTSVPVEIRAVTAAEIEARQRASEAGAQEAEWKRQTEEAAAAAAAKKRQEAEAATAAAIRERRREEAKANRIRRKLLSTALKQCRKTTDSKRQRVRCEKRAKRQYGGKQRSKR